MTLLALAVGEPTQRERIRAAKERNAVVEREADAGVELPGDVIEPEGGQTAAHTDFICYPV